MQLRLLHGGSEPDDGASAVAPSDAIDDWLERADASLRIPLSARLAGASSTARDRAHVNLEPIVAAGLRSEREVLAALSPTTPAGLCISACGLVACLGGPEAATPRLCHLLHEAPSTRVRMQAAHALGRLGGVEARTALVQALSRDQDEDVRARVARALGSLRDRRAISTLGATLTSAAEAPAVRSEAAEALGLIGCRSVLPLLGGALGAQAPDVRAAAAIALGLLGDVGDLPALQALTSDHTMTSDLGPVSGCASAAMDDIRCRTVAVG